MCFLGCRFVLLWCSEVLFGGFWVKNSGFSLDPCILKQKAIGVFFVTLECDANCNTVLGGKNYCINLCMQTVLTHC